MTTYTTHIAYTTQAMINACISANAAIADLRDALGTATAVESIVILQLIAQAAEFANGIKALQSARNEQP